MHIIEYVHYPYLMNPEDIIEIRWPGLKLSKIINYPSNPVKERTLEILRSILEKGRITGRPRDADVEVLAFYALITITKILGDRKLAQRIAVSYSKNAWYRLRDEPLPVIVSIARALGIDASLADRPPKIPIDARGRTIIYLAKPFMIRVTKYLSLTRRLAGDPKYMLVNQVADKGWIYLEKELFTRILEEAVARRILQIYEEMTIENPEEYGGIIGEAKKILEEAGWFEKQRLAVEIEKTTEGVVDPEAYPPCMRKLLNRLTAGENLGHHERFTIAAFLARIGLDVDTILEYFKNAPDFNEKIARYQIEHIAGLRGSRKKYLPYNCDTMKSYGLCPIQGYCEGGKNPLAVYKRNLWKKLKEKRRKAERGSEAGASSDNTPRTTNYSVYNRGTWPDGEPAQRDHHKHWKALHGQGEDTRGGG